MMSGNHDPGSVEEIFYLLFVSAAAELFSEDELLALLETARRNNSRRGVTGLLLYYDGSFIEIIEGRRETVEWLFAEKISKDARHHGITKLISGFEPQRSFPSWSMGFVRPDRNMIDEHLPNFNDLMERHTSPEAAFPEVFHPLMVFLRGFYTASGYEPKA
jgi:hypothetical protein